MDAHRWPSLGIAYGADYNPEQWPAEVWREDVALMRRAGVDLVSVGIFSWGLLEPEPGRFDWGWLDEVLDLLHAHGIGVDLATPSAAPPVWLHRAHPEILPLDLDGRRWSDGSRESWCPSSPVLRAHAVRIAGEVARRYADHPAVRMWHISNELGCHNARCYCEVSAAAFRDWLRARYRTIGEVNDAWGTAFWSQHLTSFEQVEPPRRTTAFTNPGQRLDYARFTSDELVAHLRAEVAAVRAHASQPVTTNFMVMEGFDKIDYAVMADEVDLVSNDHYLVAEDPESWAELAFSADRTRGLAGGAPWLLMEHSTGAVNWQPRNLAKGPGQLRRNSLAHVARGADGVLFFQWRASAAGAEKYHSAMVPHAGPDSATFAEVVGLGQALGRLAEVRGSRVATADVALLWDSAARWAVEAEAHPTVDLHYLDQAHRLHRALTDAGVSVDVLPVGADLTGYRVVLVPTLYLVDDDVAPRLAEVVARGGQVLVTAYSGIVDPNDRVRLGGYPGAFRDLLGVRVEEFAPLTRGGQVALSDGSTGQVWTERLSAPDAEVLADYLDGPSADGPAITRRDLPGGGSAWYLSTLLDRAGTARLVEQVCVAGGVRPVVVTVPGVEVVRRVADAGSWLFAINHTDTDAELAASGVDLLTGARHERGALVPAGGVVVLRERA